MKKRRLIEFVLAAVMAALAGVLDAFVSIRIGTYIKFTLYGLPLLFTGIMYGPFVGGLTGLVAGVITQLFSPYGLTPTTPLWLIAPIIWGLVSGLISLLFKRSYSLIKIMIMVIPTALLATIMNSLVIFLDGVIMDYPTGQTIITILIRVATSIVLSIIYIGILYIACNRLKNLLHIKQNDD